MEANADPDLEVVVLAPDETYTLTLAGADEDQSSTGDLDVDGSLRVVGNGAVVDGASLDRVFDLHDGAVEIAGVTITGGSVDGAGGGIRNDSAGLQLHDSAVVGNRALVGGGIFNAGEAAVVNVSLLDNTATGETGGALENGPVGRAVLWTSTVTGNRAGTAGGGLASSAADGANFLVVIGSVVADNGTALDGTPTDCAGPTEGSTIASFGYNLDGGSSCGFTATGDLHGDPMLGPTIDPPDTPPFRRPLPGSPLVDALPNGADECLPDADQRGVARPQGARCDIGAVEALATELTTLALTVDTPADTTDLLPGDGLCADSAGRCSLRAAVQETNAYPTPDMVTIANGIHPRLSITGIDEDTSATGDLDIHGQLDLTAAGATIDADAIDRVFDVHGDGQLSLTDATVTDGHARAGCGVRAEGGGVRVVDGFARLERVTLADNLVDGSNEGYGGGLANVGGAVVVFRSAIVDNHVTGAPCAASGGATRAEGGGIANDGVLSVEQSTIAQNLADTASSSGGVGGGVLNHDGEAALIASTLVDNDADGVGAGLVSYTNGANPVGGLVLRGTLIARNDCGDPAQLSGQAADTLTSSGYNAGDAGCGLTATGDVPGSIAVPALGDNGGPTPTILPAPGMSPIDAIPAGTAGLCDATVDQRGTPRPFDGDADGDAACDIGSVESTVVPAPVTFVVDSADDLPDGVLGDGLCRSVGTGRCTLRAAVQETNRWPTADTITIAAGVSPELTRNGANEDAASTGDLDVVDHLVIDGNGSTVDANRIDRVLHVLSTVTIRDLTIRGGGNGTDGAGVRNQGGRLLLERVTLTDNQGRVGGGVRNDNSGVLDVVDSTISGNSSTGNGAGVYAASGETDIRFTTITANSSGTGGAVRGDGVFRVGATAIGDQTDGVDCAGTITTLGYNVVTTVTGCPTPATGDTAAVSLALDPLADNGGLTPTHMPRPTSPLRDRVAPATATLCDGTHPLDQRGVTRPIDSDSDGVAQCDSGSVEAPVAPQFVDPPTVVPSNGAPITLEAVPAGGTFSGPGVTGDVLNPAVGGTGNRTISYNHGGQTVTTVVEVFRVSLSYTTSPAMIGNPNITYTFTGTPSGGTYSTFVIPGSLNGNVLVTTICGTDFVVEYSGRYKGVRFSTELTVDRPTCPKPVP
jgi:CSLREA domain-containing protein